MTLCLIEDCCFMLSIVLLNVIMLSGIILNVVAPNLRQFRRQYYMENLMVIRVEVIAPEKPLLSKHLQK